MGTAELKELYLAIRKFREAMERDLRLNDSERLSLENHIALLQITYMEWKRRNAQKLAYAYRQAACILYPSN
jgi:hypothetical protein